MAERHFDQVWFLPGDNGGRYPFCNSVFVEGAGVVIDPASNRERLEGLRKDPGVSEVWLSHWHEDHIMHLDLFDDLPLMVHEADAPPLADIEEFLGSYAMEDEEERERWRQTMEDTFHYKPRKPARAFKGDEIIELGSLTVDVIHAPGHTPGNLAFFFREPAVLFLGDYDLTRFGPWYGDRESDIDDTITSVQKLRQVPAKFWLTGHEDRVFEQDPGEVWDRYLEVIEEREQKLLSFLTEPRTMDDVIDQWIVYRKPKEPKEFFVFGERAIMGKHLERLMDKGRVSQEGDQYILL